MTNTQNTIRAREWRLLLSLFVLFLILPAWKAQAQQPCVPTADDPTKCSGGSQHAPTPPTITNVDSAAEEGVKEKKATSTTERSLREESQRAKVGEPNPFAQFVKSSTGSELPLYGFSLFNQPPTTFAPIDEVPVTADYVIGPGDELVIRAWGQLDIDYRNTVDRSGRIFLPKVGEITVAGLKADEIEPRVREAISRNYHDFHLSVSLGRLRAIRIFVVGQSARPGAYTVSSLSTVVNAVLASGGPTANGSIRCVQLKRGGKVVTEFDFYDLLAHGDKSKDVHLLPGDVIYIPPVGPQVALTGAVTEPAIYELKNEKTLNDLLRLAGGLPTTAEASRAQVQRLVENRVRTVAEIPLDGAGLTVDVHSGDIVLIMPISGRFDNAVTLRGSVSRAGQYPWKTGMTVRDLIPNAAFLIPENVWTKRNVITQKSPAAAAGHNPEDENAFLVGPSASPAINWEYASIDRLDPTDLTVRIIPFNLGKALNGNAEENKALEAGDVVTIYTQRQLRSPMSARPVYVRVEGEVAEPGLYRAAPGETLRAFVNRVSRGFTNQAYLFGAQFSRDSVRVRQQANIEEAARQLEMEIRPAKTRLTAASNIQAALEVAAEQEKERQQRVAIVRALRASGRIVLGTKPSSSGVDDLPDFVLEDGDTLYIPGRPATVSVFGAVYNNADFAYRRDQTVERYLKLAGGPTRTADKGKIYVLRADGSVRSGGSAFGGGIEHLRVFPGDTIFVPERKPGPTFGETFRNWSQAIGELGLGAAAIKVLMQ